MSKKFDKKLIRLLETDRRLTDQNGRLIKQLAVDKAWRTDHQLVRLLLSDPEVKAHERLKPKMFKQGAK